MSGTKAFRSRAAWAACFALLAATWLVLPQSLAAQEASGGQPIPAEVQPTPTEGGRTEDAAPSGGEKSADDAAGKSDAAAGNQPDAADTKLDEANATDTTADDTTADESKGDDAKPGDAKSSDAPSEEPAAEGKTADGDKPADGVKADAPKTDEPQTDAPKSDAPTTDEPKTDAAKNETPKTEAPKAEAPKTEAPKAEAPKTDSAETSEAQRIPADVSSLSPEARFRLVDAMRNQDDQITPAEYEMARKRDADLTPQKEFAELDIDNNKSLSVDEFAAGFDNLWLLGAIVLATFLLPFAAAIYICRAIRLPEYATRMGFVLLAVAGSIVVVALGHVRYGIDLKGGVILVYEVDKEKTEELSGGAEAEGDYMDRLIAALNLRVNPGGQKEIVIRKFGEREVEIIVPEAQPAEIEQLKKTIRTAGFLEFRIMANRRNLHKAFPRVDDINQFVTDLTASTTERDVQTDVYNSATGREEKVTVARWIPVDATQMNVEHETALNKLILRKNAEGQDEALALVREPFQEDEWVVHGSQLRSAGMSRDPEEGGLAVTFKMSTIGAANLGNMTGQFPPEDNKNFLHRMGIVFDGKLISAPGLKEPISENVMITGRYTRQDVSAMVNVLNAGSLPAVLSENPVSQNEIGATVGEDTIRKGRTSIIVSTLLVLAFMAAFYRFSGVVACGALLLNVLITFAVVILFKAPLTLPGLAGLALGVGMAVDANVLIFERIREELERGAALRMAIRNGFDRATTTIIDSNLTTVITGLVLYWIGTDQVKGFAVTLIVGIVANLFTAITATRLVFDLADKKRLLSKLTMSRLISGTNFDFVGKQRLCFAVSMVLIVVGLAATFTRGVTLLDIDFAGGTSAEVVFDKSKNVDEIRTALADKGVPDATVSRIVRPDGQEIQFKIDTSLGNPSSLGIEFGKRDANGDGKLDQAEYVVDRKGRIGELAKDRFAQLDANGDGFIEEGEFKLELEDVLHFYLEYAFDGELRHNSLTYSAPAPIEGASAASRNLPPRVDAMAAMPLAPPIAPPAAASVNGRGVFRLASYQDEPAEPAQPDENPDAAPNQTAAAPGDEAAIESDPTTSAAQDSAPNDPEPATSPPAKTEPSKAEPAQNDAKSPAPETTQPAAAQSPESTPKTESSAAPESPTPTGQPSAGTMRTTTTLTFAEKLPYRQVQGALEGIVKEKFPSARIRVTHAEAPGSQEATDKWVLDTTLSGEQTKAVVDAYSAKLAGEPVFPARNHIGGAVADKSQQLAVLAIAVSLVAIIVYVWIRFQKVIFGVAAVAALVHDVLVTLGVLALSSYFAAAIPGLAAVLQIDPFKINLTVVAAFLTIIGFSINDTIVIFDRVREIRGKSPYLTAEMVNASVNQMLGRTFLTSFTVLLVVFILYFFGGEAIHAFSFAMLVGLISGVYSTVFIATPIVLWMSAKPQPTKSELRSPAQVA